MDRCTSCQSLIWPFQARGPHLLGALHRRCYYELYREIAAGMDVRVGGLSFWDAVLMAPPDISADLLRRHDAGVR